MPGLPDPTSGTVSGGVSAPSGQSSSSGPTDPGGVIYQQVYQVLSQNLYSGAPWVVFPGPTPEFQMLLDDLKSFLASIFPPQPQIPSQTTDISVPTQSSAPTP